MNAVKWNFASTVIGALLGIVQLWALSHILSPHQYGVVSAALMIILALNVFLDFGLSNSIIRQQKITELELSSLYSINIAMGIAIFLIAYFGSIWAALFFKSPELELQIKIMSFVFLLAPFGQQQRAILAREMRFNFISVVVMITLLLNFLIVIILAIIYKDAWVASVAFLISTSINSLIFFIHSLKERRLSFKYSWASARPHIRYSSQLVIDSIINLISINTYPALMARLVNLTAIGGYNIASNISINLIERLKPVLTQALFPAFAKIQDDDARLSKNFLVVTTYGSLINFPLLFGILVSSSEIVRLFFNAEWQFIDSLVKILCVVGIFRSIDAPVISLLLVKGKMHLNVRMGIIKLIVGVILAYTFGKAYGIHGIAVSFLIVQILNTISGYFFLVKPCLKNIGKSYLINLAIPFFQLIPIFLLSGFFTQYPLTTMPFANLLIVILTGIVSYIVGLYFSPFLVAREFLHLATASISLKLKK